MSAAPFAYLAAIGALLALGFAGGIKYHADADAREARQAQELRESDARQQRAFGDLAAGRHAAAVSTLQTQLGNAREKIAALSGRECLDPGTVRLLDAIGTGPVRAPAGEPARAAEAPAADPGRPASDRDAARAIAACRGAYAELSSQLNQILDIEERRHGAGQR